MNTVLAAYPPALIDRLELYGSRDSWLAAFHRTEPTYSIGGTAAAGILLGDGWRVWSRAHELDEDDGPRNVDALESGLWWEPHLIAWWGYKLLRGPVWSPLSRAVHPSYPWLRTSPDGFGTDSDRGVGLVEIKTRRSRAGWGKGEVMHEKAGAAVLSSMPPNVAIQCYGNLAASGLPYCDVVVAFGIRDIRRYRLLADESYQGWLVTQLDAWRTRHLVELHHPPLDPSVDCRDYLSRQERGTATREATDAEAVKAARYAVLGRALKAGKAERSQLFAELAAAMGEIKTLTIRQQGKPGRFTNVGKFGKTSNL